MKRVSIRKVLIVLLAVEVAAAILAWVSVNSMPLVSHAGGFVGDTPYTNSFDAFERSLDAGLTAIEVDFDFTVEADGARRLVCNHDWDRFGGARPTYDAWRAAPVAGTTPCDADTLGSWVRANEAVTIITDVKATDHLAALAALAEAGLPRGRTIVQIYAPEEHEAVLAAGWHRQWLTLYRYRGEREAVVDLAKAGGVEAVVMAPGALDGSWRRGLGPTPIYVHTINSPLEAAALRLRGADGLYTDVNAPSWWSPLRR